MSQIESERIGLKWQVTILVPALSSSVRKMSSTDEYEQIRNRMRREGFVVQFSE